MSRQSARSLSPYEKCTTGIGIPWRSTRGRIDRDAVVAARDDFAEAAQLHQGGLQVAHPFLERSAKSGYATGVMGVERVGVLELRHEAADVVALPS